MRKCALALVSVFLVVCLLASCGEQTVQDKLKTIEKGWTMQQVVDLLGEPSDELSEMSSCIVLKYAVDETTTATLYFGGENMDECFRIVLRNRENGGHTTVME